jgi:hypothetical protein
MGDGVTIKAVRDELAALGHDLSEDVVASLLEDAGAADLLNSLEATSNPAYEGLEATGHSPAFETHALGFGPGTTMYVNQSGSARPGSREDYAEEHHQTAEAYGEGKGSYESESDTHQPSPSEEWTIPAEGVGQQVHQPSNY